MKILLKDIEHFLEQASQKELADIQNLITKYSSVKSHEHHELTPRELIDYPENLPYHSSIVFEEQGSWIPAIYIKYNNGGIWVKQTNGIRQKLKRFQNVYKPNEAEHQFIQAWQTNSERQAVEKKEIISYITFRNNLKEFSLKKRINHLKLQGFELGLIMQILSEYM